MVSRMLAIQAAILHHPQHTTLDTLDISRRHFKHHLTQPPHKPHLTTNHNNNPSSSHNSSNRHLQLQKVRQRPRATRNRSQSLLARLKLLPALHHQQPLLVRPYQAYQQCSTREARHRSVPTAGVRVAQRVLLCTTSQLPSSASRPVETCRRFATSTRRRSSRTLSRRAFGPTLRSVCCLISDRRWRSLFFT